jgi:hypothetical protein
MIGLVTPSGLSEMKERWESEPPRDEFRKIFMRSAYLSMYLIFVLAFLFTSGAILTCIALVIYAFGIFYLIGVLKLIKALGQSRKKFLLIFIPTIIALGAVVIIGRDLAIGALSGAGLL